MAAENNKDRLHEDVVDDLYENLTFVLNYGPKPMPITPSTRAHINAIIQEFEGLIRPVLEAYSAINVKLDTQRDIDKLALQLFGLGRALQNVFWYYHQNWWPDIIVENPIKNYSTMLVDNETESEVPEEIVNKLSNRKYTAELLREIKRDRNTRMAAGLLGCCLSCPKEQKAVED